MTSSFTTRLSALLAATGAALALAITAGPAAADEETFEDPEGMAAACSTTPVNDDKVTLDGRYYRIHVPAGISAAGAPLLVAIHGGHSSPERHASETGWNGFVDQKKAIVVYPRGSKDGETQDNGQPGWGWHADDTDVAHIMKVVANVRAKYCVDPRRIHLSGHSNGGQMASRAGCVQAGFFASGAVYAPAPPPTGCNPSRAISWGVFASAGDTTVLEPVAYGHLMYWNWENRPCGNEQNDGGTDVKDSNRWSCDAGTQTLWRVYNGGSHQWPTGARRTEMMNRMWQLFQAYPRP
ncbi:CE1 family esterase [Nocardia goodfellowii]|uniref:Polyhydroxybutyrate depolymerase n=1 Tax=Nocardia goodfellowii TaxID=882446 RepID=A0ABS4QQB8_9NOCA|nr:PHB depolymerase family esterase [Nocardia goodfellowii]MBP2193877.1 polyhydroxybutyrate depolymerase [Nocardia goodfellowii]